MHDEPPTQPPAQPAPAGALTHLDARGRARMVDVGAKPVTLREAVAVAGVRLSPAAAAAIAGGRLPKGDALAVARLAGIQAAKRTAEWIPLCHPLPLDLVEVALEVDAPAGRVAIRARARARARTGVEMEALVAASAAALALYDMVKSADRAMVIEEVRLERKSGGRHGDFVHPRAGAGGAPGTAGAPHPGARPGGSAS